MYERILMRPQNHSTMGTTGLTIPFLMTMLLVTLLACAPANESAQRELASVSAPAPQEEPTVDSTAELTPAPTPTPALEVAVPAMMVVTPQRLLDNLQTSEATMQPEPTPQVTATPTATPTPTPTAVPTPEPTPSPTAVPTEAVLDMAITDHGALNQTPSPLLQADDTWSDPPPTPTPTPEPEDEKEEAQTPVNQRCYSYGDEEKCFALPARPPTPAYTYMLDQFSVAAQKADMAIADAERQGKSADTVEIPVVHARFIVKTGTDPATVIAWLEEQGLVKDSTREPVEDWAKRYHQGLPGIYKVSYRDRSQPAKGSTVYTVLPADLLKEAYKVPGVSHLMDGRNKIPRP